MMRTFRVSGFKALLAGALMAAAWAGPLAAEPPEPRAGESPDKRLQEVEKALGEGRGKARQLNERARELQQQLNRLRRDMVAAARIIQEQELKAAELEKGLSALKTREDAKLAQFRARRNQLAGVLTALQRVARYPPEALITQPMPPADTVRSAILLRAAVPQIEHRAMRLRDDLEGLAQARREIADKKAQLAVVTSRLAREHKRLAVLFGQKTVLRHRTLVKRRAETQRVKALADKAANLRDLLERLNRTGRQRQRSGLPGGTGTAEPKARRTVAGLPAGLTGRPISGARGKLPPPVMGRIVGRYGQAKASGLTRKGITLQSAPGAQVVAPYEGHVVYAGKFRSYGQLLIIEHGEGYHSLLVGLARIDSTMGQWVVAGEPVGVMGRPDNRKPLLYVEFRRNGQPINPLPWLAARKDKVKG